MPIKWTEQQILEFANRRGDDECWLWSGTLLDGRYPRALLNREHMCARRAIKIMFNPDDDGEGMISRACKNSSICVNPKHTYYQNVRPFKCPECEYKRKACPGCKAKNDIERHKKAAKKYYEANRDRISEEEKKKRNERAREVKRKKKLSNVEAQQKELNQQAKAFAESQVFNLVHKDDRKLMLSIIADAYKQGYLSHRGMGRPPTFIADARRERQEALEQASNS